MLTLAPHLLDTVLTHLRRALPWEGCGLLGGSGDIVQVALPVPNVASRRDRFRMAPNAQVRALLDLEAQGLLLLAIYHSHPSGPPHPSATDLAAHAYPAALQVIVAHPEQRQPTISAWRLLGQSVTSIPLRIA